MKLVIFDVDGTLVDSQADILAAMARAFAEADLPCPDRKTVLSIVGLSLPEAMAQLAPQTSDVTRNKMVEGYKAAYMELRAQSGVAKSSPLYPGIRPMLDRLRARDDLLLGVATGKSRRGLDKLIEGHGLEGMFVTQQVADFHPSKPHPAMLLEAMSACGTAPEDTLMIGDTSYDMEMARAAGCRGIGVSWGYHEASALGAARAVIDRIEDLTEHMHAMWGIKI
ncbi:HAD-IA family hydrolase [Roseobacteraceae bacterium S113]